MSRAFSMPCGCEYDGKQWNQCEQHARKTTAEHLLVEVIGEPKCPEGCGDARRPKCMWEMGAGCPRHAILDPWNEAVRGLTRYLEAKEWIESDGS